MIDLEFLEKLIHLLDDSGIDHVELERGGTRILVAKTPTAGGNSTAPSAGSSGAAGPAGTAIPAAPTAPEAPAALPETLAEVTSPMVGTFYRSPSPDQDAFTDVGERITKGDTLCIIEAMKLMNELEADIDGVVREVCVSNGEPVEYGQVLFRVEPA